MGAIGNSEQGEAECGSISKGFPRIPPCAELVRGELFPISMFLKRTELQKRAYFVKSIQFHRLYKTSGGATTGLWKHMISVHKDVKIEKDIQ